MIALLVLVPSASLAIKGEARIPAPEKPEETTVDPRVAEIARELRCPICQNLSVADSPTELATQMRALIEEKLQAGESPEAIKAYFVSKYGDWILLKPKREGFTWLVWLLPVAGLLVGAGAVVVFTRRSMAQRSQEEEPAETPAQEEYARRLEREIEELET
jgi:cytochrome c-type biogenesis protein CcmH